MPSSSHRPSRRARGASLVALAAPPPGAPPPARPTTGGSACPRFCASGGRRGRRGRAAPGRRARRRPVRRDERRIPSRRCRGVPRPRRRRPLDERATFGPRGGNDIAVHDGHLYLALSRTAWSAGGSRRGSSSPRATRDRRRRAARTAATTARRRSPFPVGDVMLVKIGSATNSCQRSNRARSPRAEDPVHRARAARGPLALRRRPRGPDVRRRPPLGDGPPERGGADGQPGTGAVWAAIHGRDQLGAQLGIQRRGQRQQSGRGAGAGRGRRRHRLALLLLQQRRAQEGAGPRVRRRRARGRPLREAKDAGDRVPRALGADGAGVLPRHAVRAGVHGRAVRHLPRELEPRAAAAGGLPGGVRAVRGRQAHRDVPDLRHA